MTEVDLEGLSRREIMKFVRSPSDIVFLSGSRVEGLGNANSDFDLYAITSGAQDEGSPRIEIASDKYTDFEQWTPESMEELASTINSIPLEAGSLSRLPLPDIDRYYRTAIARVAFNPTGFNQLVSKFSKSRCQEVLTGWGRCHAAIALAEAKALRMTGLDLASLARLRQAAEYAVDALLAEHEEGFPSLKWRREKLERAGLSSVGVKLASLAGLGAHDFSSFVRQVEAFIGSIGPTLCVRPNKTTLRPAEGVAAAKVGRDHLIGTSSSAIYVMDDLGALIWSLATHQVSDIVKEVADAFDSSESEAETVIESFMWLSRRRRLLTFDVIECEPPRDTVEFASAELTGRMRSMLTPARARGSALLNGISEASAGGIWLSTLLYDIKGARDAGQIGLLAWAARTFVDRACSSKVLLLGFPLDSAEIGIASLSQVDPLLAKEALHLYCEEPTNLEDASDYADRCIAFVERLGVPIPGVGSGEQSAYQAFQNDVSALGEIFGFEYVGSPSARFLEQVVAVD